MIEAIKQNRTVSCGLVSVIIPVFNVRPYLAEALDSVLWQTYENLEIIIIDDGSTDGSKEICDEYATKDARILVIHQENRGLSAARNVGLDKLSGEMVVFLDPDDAYHPRYVQIMMDVMVQEQADLVICPYTVHFTMGKMKFRDQKSTSSIAPRKYDRVGALRALADSAIGGGVWNKLYRRWLWEEIRFPNGHVCEDTDVIYRIIDLCKTVYVVKQSLYLYRKRPGSITDTASWKNMSDFLLAHSHFTSFIEANTPKIFTIEQLRTNLQQCLPIMISFYLRRHGIIKAAGELSDVDLRKMIINKGKETGIETCDLRTRVAYWMLCSCPNLLRIINPLYRLVRLFFRRVVGR